jgi:tRNA G18 (ribose-2'-O)-methylase SpoU
VVVTDAARAALADVFAARPDVPVYVVPQAVVDGVTGVNIHRGCLAIGERPAPMPWRELVRLPDFARASSGKKPDTTTVLVLERVANADNVGGIFRNAAAFGVNAVLLDPVSIDPLYRKAVRTSMGAALRVPFARAEPWPRALHELRQEGLALVAMTPSGDAPPLRDCVARLASRRVAIVLGHEGDGLTPAALDACEYRAHIPMAGGVDSLNVASAAAIALYELGRQDV